MVMLAAQVVVAAEPVPVPPKHRPPAYAPASKGVLVTKQDYSKMIMLEPKDFDQLGHQLQVVIVPPKTRMRMHWHPKETEVFYVLEGGSWLILDGKKYMTVAGDSFIVRPGVKHTVWNDSDKPFKQVVFKIDYPEGNDTVWMEGNGK
jgi:quercetin dioxygenase-like cupin family protein